MPNTYPAPEPYHRLPSLSLEVMDTVEVAMLEAFVALAVTAAVLYVCVSIDQGSA